MQLYLDTSALTKLVVPERESTALRRFVSDHEDDTGFVAALAQTELIRAVVRRGMPDAVAHARRLLRSIDMVPLTGRLLNDAALLPPSTLRSLDAIHLAAARTAPALRAIITYDDRLAEAAESLGMPVARPD